jgi:hypothetical protein
MRRKEEPTFMTTTGIRFDSIDDCLGPATGRFFGDGFRRVVHRIADITVRPGDNGRGRVDAKAGLRYPPDWSTKSTDVTLRPHLSSVDALLIAVRLGEMYLTHTHGLDRSQRRRMWLRRCTMKTPSAPQEDLSEFDVEAVNVDRRAEPNSLCGHVSVFECVIGTLKLTCEIEHDVSSADPDPESARCRSLSRLRADPRSGCWPVLRGRVQAQAADDHEPGHRSGQAVHRGSFPGDADQHRGLGG